VTGRALQYDQSHKLRDERKISLNAEEHFFPDVRLSRNSKVSAQGAPLVKVACSEWARSIPKIYSPLIKHGDCSPRRRPEKLK
jgi:hypothetical protein